jgi:hypothetical protein
MEEKRSEIAKKALEALNELEEKTTVENLIKDNMIRFKVNDCDYRLRLPTQADQEELNKYRMKEYAVLVKDKDYMFREEWEALYKTRGIDIKKMENQVKEIHQKIKDFLLKLAQTQQPKDIDLYKKEITELRDKQYDISIKRTDLLSYCIEDQLQIRTTTYLCYLVLDKKETENWVRAFVNLEEFKNCPNPILTNQALYFMNYLLYNA